MFVHPLARDVAIIIALKAAIVVAALFLLSPRRVEVTSDSVAAHLLPAPSEVRQ